MTQQGWAERWARTSYEHRETLWGQFATTVIVALLYGGTAWLRGDAPTAVLASVALLLHLVYSIRIHGYNQWVTRLRSEPEDLA